MLIWLGVVGTVVALTGIGLLFLLYFLLSALRTLTELMQSETKKFLDELNEFFESGESALKRHAEKIETADKDMLLGVKSLREAWETLATEIRTRYQNYDKAQRLAMRQIQAIEFLEKTMKSIQGARRHPSDNVSVPSEADAKAMEELTDTERIERLAIASAAAGVGEEEFDMGG